MKKEIVILEEKKLVGITVRTSYQNEINPATAKISPCVRRYFQEELASKTPNVKNPQAILCAYTDYESDYTEGYTYFIGQEVTAIDALPEGLEALIIPSQTYVKFTTDPEPMPQVIINAWQKIWQMSPKDLGGMRSWKADFEVHDERAHNPQRTILDLYVGIEKGD
jgi:predicted transcriptional regulator YdeE